MRMFLSDRARLVTAAICLALAGNLAGCAAHKPVTETPTAAPATGTVPSGMTTTEPSTSQRFLNFFRPYRVDIQQGNFVSREMVAQVKEGMTPDQVRFALGTPLLTDIFHADRWDYVFRLKKRNGEVLESRVTVRFKDGRVASIEGNQLPTEEEYLKYIAGTPESSK